MLKQGKVLVVASVSAILLAFGMFGVTLREKATALTKRQPETIRPVSPAPTPNSKMSEAQTSLSATPAPEPHPVDERSWKLMRGYIGNWHASSMEGTQVRIFNFELRDSSTIPGAYTGYSTLTEVGLTLPTTLKPQANIMEIMAAKTNPHAIVWIGEPEAGGVTFRVEKRIGTQHCPMTSLTATPFGANQLVVEWKSEGCADGRMLLSK